jgi:translation initiation factor 2A
MAGALAVPADMFTPGLETPATEGLDPLAKKIRNLTKKLKAIEDLKVRVDKGDRLEATQLKKIEGEAEIRKELAVIQGPSA